MTIFAEPSTTMTGALTVKQAKQLLDIGKTYEMIDGNKCNSGDTYFQRGVCGLQNLGNTCFMNSALQCLSNVPELNDYFLTEQFVKDINEQNPLGTQGRLVKAYAQLLKEMWSGRVASLRPFKLKCVIGQFAPRFNGYIQQDSQELIAFLLDGLHEDMNRAKKQPDIEDKEVVVVDGHNEAQTQNAEDAWKDYQKRNDSFIVDLMHGHLKSTLTCKICQKMSIKFDPFCFLSIPIPANHQEVALAMASSSSEQADAEQSMEVENEDPKNAHSLENGTLPGPMEEGQQGVQRSGSQLSLIEYSYGLFSWLFTMFSYFAPLKLFSDMVKNFFANAIPLETCLKIFFSIDQLCGEDKYSCEHCKKLRNGTKHSSLTRLPRILIIHLKRFRHEGSYNVKLRTPVKFPLFGLDMAPFMHGEVCPGQDGQPIPTKYDLCGMISHRGHNMEYGHYIAFCRNTDQKWYEFDDSQVTRVSPLEVASQEAYVLFYERRELPSVSEEEQDEEEEEEEQSFEDANDEQMETMEMEEEDSGEREDGKMLIEEAGKGKEECRGAGQNGTQQQHEAFGSN